MNKAEGFKRLREPFPDNVIGKLPRGGSEPKVNCSVCHGYHKTGAIHLDFVGHANVTDRLLEVDPEWTWEPFAVGEDGLPALVRNSQGFPIGLWIKLTVLGVTRLGFGSCEGGKNDPIKELIGDALRNGAMRFGVALELWTKTELELGEQGAEHPTPAGPNVEEVVSASEASPQTVERGAGESVPAPAPSQEKHAWLDALRKSYSDEAILQTVNAIRSERPKAADRVPLDSIEEVGAARKATQEEIHRRLAEQDWSAPKQQEMSA